MRRYALVLTNKQLEKGLAITVNLDDIFPLLLYNNTANPRPLAHDVMMAVIEKAGAKVESVEIYGAKQSEVHVGGNKFLIETFLTRINISQKGKEIALDSRPSDAVALAFRAKAPIYVVKRLLKETGGDFQSAVRHEQLMKLEEEDLEPFKV
jgi:bifunctional DNase/RNase